MIPFKELISWRITRKILVKNGILASGIAFSFAHIIYFSWLSIILILLAGFYFAYEYSKTRSVLFTSVLHGILGDSTSTPDWYILPLFQSHTPDNHRSGSWLQSLRWSNPRCFHNLTHPLRYLPVVAGIH
ncbi:MAG: CPBP family intramembrane metalloprotease [Bacteroidia bacterium]|nr:CPBP family intramembrane metalloprotease [Bacteroidia bacterium]